MKAVVNQKYGSPDIFELKDIEKPIPKDHEVLVKIHAASINSWDWDYLTGKPRTYRLLFGLFKPRQKILGCDVAGSIKAVGKNVNKLKPGDEVYGDVSSGNWGGFAEYVCAKENELTLKPSNLTFEEAAAVPQAAVLAFQGLHYNGEIKPGTKVLINGAGGGVGTFGLQLAKMYGAEVTCTDRTEKLDKLLKLGADHVIDCTKKNFKKNSKTYDLVLDNVVSGPVSSCKRVLNPNGNYVIVGGSIPTILKTLLFGKRGSRKTGKKASLLIHKPNTVNLDILTHLFETSKLKPIVDKCFSLEEVPQAFKYYNKGNFQGKIVISMNPDN